MAVTTLAGVINSEVYTVGYYPQGTDVGLDFTTIINKLNEVINQSNADNATVSSHTTSIANNAALASTNATDIDAEETARAAADSALDTRVSALEGSSGLSVLAWETGDAALTLSQLTGNTLIVLEAQSATSTNHELPTAWDSGNEYVTPVTIVNNGHTYSKIHLADAGGAGSWLDGTSGQSDTNYIKLTDGQSVTLWPAPGIGGNSLTWAVLGGNNSGFESDP